MSIFFFNYPESSTRMHTVKWSVFIELQSDAIVTPNIIQVCSIRLPLFHPAYVYRSCVAKFYQLNEFGIRFDAGGNIRYDEGMQISLQSQFR